MRYSTSRRYEFGLKSHIPVTRLDLDCGHSLTYYGNPEVAEQMLRDNGGTVAGNLSRCKECASRYQVMVQDIIRQARQGAGL